MLKAHKLRRTVRLLQAFLGSVYLFGPTFVNTTVYRMVGTGTIKQGTHIKPSEPRQLVIKCHKWLGRMLTAKGSHNETIDIHHHPLAAAKAFHANKNNLCDKPISVCKGFRFECSWATRSTYRGHLQIKHQFAEVGVRWWTPGGFDWSQPSRNIWHLWNERVDAFVIQICFSLDV